ncbi:MAG: DUF308 domain-containing protein [Edaphobacter sp.]
MNNATPPCSSIPRHSIGWSIALSILLILAGLVAILLPPIMGLGVTLYIGWLLVLSGITHLIFAWKSHTTRAVLWEVLVGLVYLFAGGYLILHPLAGLLSLTLFLALYLVVEGVFEIILAFQLVHSGRTWMILEGAITIILAIMIWRSWPYSTIWAIGTLVGISMIFSGISRLMFSLACRRSFANTV